MCKTENLPLGALRRLYWLRLVPDRVKTDSISISPPSLYNDNENILFDHNIQIYITDAQ